MQYHVITDHYFEVPKDRPINVDEYRNDFHAREYRKEFKTLVTDENGNKFEIEQKVVTDKPTSAIYTISEFNQANLEITHFQDLFDNVGKSHTVNYENGKYEAIDYTFDKDINLYDLDRIFYSKLATLNGSVVNEEMQINADTFLIHNEYDYVV